MSVIGLDMFAALSILSRHQEMGKRTRQGGCRGRLAAAGAPKVGI